MSWPAVHFGLLPPPIFMQSAEDATAATAAVEAAADSRRLAVRSRPGSFTRRASSLHAGRRGTRRQRSALAVGTSALSLASRRGSAEGFVKRGSLELPVHVGHHHKTAPELPLPWQHKVAAATAAGVNSRVSAGEEVRITMVSEATAAGTAAAKHERLLSEWPASGGCQGRGSVVRVLHQPSCRGY